MKRILPQPDEFYIGYLHSVPGKIAFFFSRLVLFIFFISMAIGGILVFSQRDFVTSEFEYGINTTLSGVLIKEPVPHVRISLGKTWKGEELYQTVLIVGSGKHGAHELLRKFPPEMPITLKGFLIYGDGKALVQVNDINDIFLNEKAATKFNQKTQQEPGQKYISVQGEITDPKCFFGVMKPGEGKAHRSCAIRCISGGIPPVLKANSSDYFLLLNENLQPVNDDVLTIVGDQVTLSGEVAELDDWKILKIDTKQMKALLETIQAKQLAALEDDMTFCNLSRGRK